MQNDRLTAISICMCSMQTKKLPEILNTFLNSLALPAEQCLIQFSSTSLNEQ